MNIFLLRHGHAVANAPSDAERPLSENGRAEVRAVIEHNLASLQNLSAVWVSPYLRTQETWQEVKAVLDTSRQVNSYQVNASQVNVPKVNAPQVLTQDAITPSGQPSQVMALIEQAQHDSLLLVTHQPLVGDLVSGLCGQPRGMSFMGTAHLAALHIEPDMPVAADLAELLWIKGPVK